MALEIDVIPSMIGTVPALVPATETDAEAIKGMRRGAIMRGKFTMMRNYEFHKRFFKMLAVVLDNMPDSVRNEKGIENLDVFLIHLKLLIGHYDAHVMMDGTCVMVPKSINFASMDQYSFEQFYKRCFDAIFANFLPIEYHALEAAVMQLERFEKR